MTDQLGPYDYANFATTRPTDSVSPPSGDTWYADCSTPTAQDGTQLGARTLNRTLANVRALWRGNGNLASSAPVVADTYSDSGLLTSILQLIQRNQMSVSTDAGSVDALVVNPTPAFREYKLGMPLIVAPAVSVNGATTINVSGLGAVAVTWPDGSALATGDWNAGVLGLLICTGSAFVLASVGGPTVWQRVSTPFNPFTTTGKGAAVLCSVNVTGGTGATDNYFLSELMAAAPTFTWTTYFSSGSYYNQAVSISEATGGTVTFNTEDNRWGVSGGNIPGSWQIATASSLTPGMAIALRVA